MADEDWAPPEPTPLAQVTAVGTTSPLAGEVPGYTDLTEVARGGDSIVYRARQASLGRDVAIKVIQVTEPAAVERFERELAITVRLGRQHPHIVTVLDTTTTTAGQPCLVMDFHDLGSVHDRIRSHGPLPASEVVNAGTAVADALAFAHNAGVLHRDVKPQNILLLPTSYVLSDFGIARRADAGHTASVERFSYRHASPQVLDGMVPTVADDVWSLGSTLFTLLDGRAPFAADNPDEDTALAYLRRVRTNQRRTIRRDDLPSGLREVVEACLAPLPEDRTPTAERALAMLRAVRTEDRSWNPLGAPAGAPGASGDAPTDTRATEAPPAKRSGAAGIATEASAPAAPPEEPGPTRPRPAEAPLAEPGSPLEPADSPPTAPPPPAVRPVATAPAEPGAPADPTPATGGATPATGPSSPAREPAAVAPSALAHLAPEPASTDADVTGMAPTADGAATGNGPSEPSALQNDQRRSGGGWRRIAAFVGGMLLAGAAVGVISALVRGDDAPTDPPATPTATPIPTATDDLPTATSTPQATVSDPDLAPQNLVVTDQGTSALLTWAPPSADVTFLVVVRIGDDDAAHAADYLPATATEYTVQGLDPDAASCFAVAGYQNRDGETTAGSSDKVCTG